MYAVYFDAEHVQVLSKPATPTKGFAVLPQLLLPFDEDDSEQHFVTRNAPSAERDFYMNHFLGQTTLNDLQTNPPYLVLHGTFEQLLSMCDMHFVSLSVSAVTSEQKTRYFTEFECSAVTAET